MRWEPERSPLWRVLGLVAGGSAAALLLAAWLAGTVVEHLAHCPLRETTGIPCPTCGGTHAVLALVHGRVAMALTANPLVTLGSIVVLAWSLWSLAATAWPPWRRTPRFTPYQRRLIALLFAAAWLANWCYELLTRRG